MKSILMLITCLFISTTIMAAEKMSKEEASYLYNLNKEVMSQKEIQMSPDTCQWQNELAEVAELEKYDCIERRSHVVDDTSKGDKLVKNTLYEANKMQRVQHYMNQKEFEQEITQSVNRMLDEYGY
jgi:hypothetical protein